MDIIGMLKGAFDAVAGIFGYAKQRDAESNTPAMQQGKVNVEAQKTTDKITKDVASKDLDAVRKDISIILVLGLFLFGGCTTTLIPKQAAPNVVAFDGNEQNGGLIRFQPLPDGRAVLTSAARDRYNMLIRMYGNQMLLPLIEDAGIVSGAFEEPYGPTYLIDAQHLAAFATMADWYRNKKPVK